MTIMATVTSRIRLRLESLHKAASKASIEAGLNRMAIRDILSGKSNSPSIDTIVAICKPLECDISYILGLSDNPNGPSRFNADHLETLMTKEPSKDFEAYECLLGDLDAMQFRLDQIRTRVAAMGPVASEPISLRDWLKENGITQSEFAEAVGIHFVHLNKFINGKTRPNWKTMERIEKATAGSVNVNSWKKGEPA